MLRVLSCPKLSRLTGHKLDTWWNVRKGELMNYDHQQSDITDIRCDSTPLHWVHVWCLLDSGFLDLWQRKSCHPQKNVGTARNLETSVLGSSFQTPENAMQFIFPLCNKIPLLSFPKYLLVSTGLIFRMNVITWSAPFLGKLTGKVPINIPYSGEHCQQETGKFPS